MSEYTFELPLRITVSVGTPGVASNLPAAGAAATAAATPADSALERVDIDLNYANRTGYDSGFLGIPVRLPILNDEQRRNAARNMMARAGEDDTILPYNHFSIVMNRRRQLAYYTVVNIDGAQSRSPQRSGDSWHFDPRIAQSEQIGEDLYRRNALDRGHLVRRLDPAWGSRAQALNGNNDTFHFTNCSPQHERFNQSNETWQGIENFLLAQATEGRKKLTIFTGPVLADDDPLYRGVRLPRFFWKVALFRKPDETLSVSAYLLDQTELIEGLERFDADEFQVTVEEISERTGLDFTYLTADQVNLDQPGVERFDAMPRVRLNRLRDVVL
ncbi:MAG: DNA/RNA non-specific endonuclease [Bryobacterales bacterium]|nr:DNA/RNA non-specific endonuclease [Bryobacterales bacterium]